MNLISVHGNRNFKKKPQRLDIKKKYVAKAWSEKYH